MAIPEKDIQTIFKCYEEARYQDTKDLLDDAIDKDMNNHHIYYFKAICCIHMNQLDEALIALGEVAYLNPDYIPSMHALAYIFLRRGDFESAMNKWLAIKTVAPKDPLVNNILNKIKSKQIQKDFLNRYNMDDFIQLDAKELKRGLAFTVEELPLSNTKIPSPTPPPENRTLTSSQPDLITHSYSSSSRKKIFRWLITLCILLILFWIALSIYQTRNKNSTSLGFIKMNNEPVFFSFQPEELQTKQAEIIQLLKSKNYNQIILALNELYYSNAPIDIKTEIKQWKSSLVPPKDINSAGQIIGLEQIFQNPFLYQGVFIQQEGRVSNFLKRPQYITFDLDIKSSSKVSNMYFFDRTTQELPFSNKDTLQVFGFIRLDEQKKPFIENTSIKLVKTADL